MKFNVMPLKKHSEISYRVKCVAVESERVFDDVVVAQQTRNLVYRADGYHFPPIYKRNQYNQVHQVMDSPDFMELNSREQSRKNSRNASPKMSKRRSKSLDQKVDVDLDRTDNRKPKVYPAPLPQLPPKQMINSLVDQLLLEIYGFPGSNRCLSESDSPASSLFSRPQHEYLQKARLQLKSETELQVLVLNLREHISHAGGLLVRYLRKKDYLLAKHDKQCNVITAHLQAHSSKRFEDTKMRFSLSPQPGESGFQQWLDAMKMVARLQGGIPPEFRKRLWLTLAERHLEQRGVDWKQAEKICFNEWSNPDDEELGIQIVKDLHRTGCSLFCGAAGRDNQAVLRRVLLGFARWNKSVGYCQGLNVLAALVLQVMDRAESSAVKVMIYLIEGVLPEGYFADNLRGLSIDMAVFRDLLRARLPKLSKHLEVLQNDAKDKATGSSYEPPLTNVFTMQWFLTLFCHCLPQDTVLRVWDLIFLEGDEVLLRTALAIWEGLSDRIMTVTSADEFYSIMGVLTREMLEFTDTNNLIKKIVSMGPLHNVTGLREKHRYNITPWARKLSDDDDSDTEEDERLAVAAAMFSMAQRLKKDCVPSTMGALQSMASSTDRERLALDISTLKQQYAKLRERQRQAHIILSAACTRQSMVPQPTSQAMNHLLVGKNALVSGKSRPLSLLASAVPPKARPAAIHSPRTQNRKDKQGITLHWKDTKKQKQKSEESIDSTERSSAVVQSPQDTAGSLPSPNRASTDSDSDSTSTELCDEPDRLSDVDSEDQTSTSDCFVTATDEDRSSRVDSVQSEQLSDGSEKPKINVAEESLGFHPQEEERNLDTPSLGNISVAKITDQIRRLSAENDISLISSAKRRIYEEEEVSRVHFPIRKSPVDDLPTSSKLSLDENNSDLKEKQQTSDDCDYLDADHTSSQVDIVNVSKQSTNEFHDRPLKSQDEETSKFSDIEEKVDVASTTDKTVESRGNSDSEECQLGERQVEGNKEIHASETGENVENVVDDFLSTHHDSVYERHTPEELRITDSEKFSLSEVTDDVKKIQNNMTNIPEETFYEKYRLSETREIRDKDMEMFIGNETVNGSSKTTSNNIGQDNSDFFSKYESSSTRIYYNEKVATTSEKDSTFETSPNLAEGKESAKVKELQESIPEVSVSVGKIAENGLTFYSTSYVVGHFPISPVSVDQKLQQKLQMSSSAEKGYAGTDVVTTDKDSDVSNRQQVEHRRSIFDTKKSPKTPDSVTSFSSGETMGPDSKPSSLTISPRTPMKSESRDFVIDKSASSSVSSNSKTLILGSIDSDVTKENTQTDSKKTTYERSSPSSPFSTDSLKNKSDASPKLVVSSSSDSCSTGKIKSSERSFSSDLQSPISANSIKYTANYNKSNRDDITDSPFDVCAATSPFYPIAHPNQKTPSPYGLSKRRNSTENSNISPEQKSVTANGTSKYLAYQSKGDSRITDMIVKENDGISGESDVYVRPQFTTKKADPSTNLSARDGKLNSTDGISANESYRESRKLAEEDIEELSEKDELTQLPQNKLDKHYYNYRHQMSTKLPFERSCSSLERTFGDLKSSASTDELKTSTAKKRSSDILQDMKHLEAKANDESSNSSLLTKKSSYIWEDMKNLEARRQDTFTDSASTFSKRVLDLPDVNVMGERRNSYVVRPKINIDEGSDSILKSFTLDKDKDNGDSDDGRESKLGVWTKVKPRKKGNNGRRSSDRALKIIQENSVILHKILACQAKKRLPDLEEISKEITISPINEEISKIFSPILEKMGLNEHEINEELARINFKDFDDVAGTNVSEFDAKINDELSKLSLIDDTEEMDRLDVEALASHDYLDTREALIDRKINEELSKLLANFEENSPASMATHDKGSSQNISDLDGLDLTSISTNVFSYKSSNDSIETRSDMGSIHEAAIQPDKLTQYKDSILPYPSTQYTQDLSPKSDIDIYRELEKLDKISSVQVIPEPSPVGPSKGLSPIKYAVSTSPYTISSPYTYETSPINTTYEPYKSYEFTSKLSPVKPASNFYASRMYDKPDTFSFMEEKSEILTDDYDPHKSILSKENLEFRVRYDDETVDSEVLNIQKQSFSLNKGIPYYSCDANEPVTPTKYTSKDGRCFESTAAALPEYAATVPDIYQRKYSPVSPKDYERSPEYNRRLSSLPLADHGNGSRSYLPVRHGDSHSLSPSRQFADGQSALTLSHYVPKLSPGLAEEAARPVSHPEFPDKVAISRLPEFPTKGSTCYKKSSMSLGNIGYTSAMNVERNTETTASPKTQFSPFPVRNVPRKPKELTLKLGLYSQKTSDMGQSKKS